MKKFIAIIALMFSGLLSAEVIPGQVLLDYFAASCPSQGEWTQSALNDSRALIGVIKAIKEDSDCKTLAGAFNQLGSIDSQMGQLAQLSENKKKIAEYDEQERDLLVEIARSTREDDISAMTASLRQIQVSRSGLVGRMNNDELSGADTTLALMQAAKSADAAFTQIVANTNCQEKAPQLVSVATGLISSIGSAISVVNPALGLGLTAGSEFVRASVDLLRERHYNSQISRIADGTTALQGYRCALESMTKRWCDLNDADVFVRYKTELRHSPITDTISGAFRLNDVEIPVLLEWLMNVRSSAPPQNTAMSNMQMTVIDRRATVDKRERYGIGRINQAKLGGTPEYQEDSSDKWKAVKNIVKDISPKVDRDMYGNPLPNPFFDQFPSGYIPYYLIGIKIEEAPTDQYGNFKDFDSWWKSSADADPKLQDVLSNFQDLIALVRARVDREYAETERPDAATTLNNAYEKNDKYEKMRPIDALANLIVFMEKYPPTDDAFKKIFDSTIEKLRDIYTNTEGAVRMARLPYSDAANNIVKTADLTFGTILLQARLEMMVRISVQRIMDEARPEDQAIIAELLASDRFMDTLKKYGGKSDTGMILDDIGNGLYITRKNLNGFSEVFGKFIGRYLKNLTKEEQESYPSVAKRVREQRAILCHLLLGVEKIPKNIDLRFCVGLKLGPQVSGAPETTPLTLASFDTDIAQRGCTYQDHIRARKIYLRKLSAQKISPVRRNLK